MTDDITQQAAHYASTQDDPYTGLNERDSEYRRVLLSLGAHRAFEWLKDHGYKISKLEDK